MIYLNSKFKYFFKLTNSNSSFTLVELLIVIGILAIVTAAVVIVLNPAQLLKQGRDSTRMTDIASIANAIRNLQTQSENVFAHTAPQTLYISLPDTSSTCGNLGLPSLPTGYSYHCVPTASSTNPDGSGWLPIDFTASPIQSLSRLPLDPVNASSSNLYYAYIADPTTQTFALYALTLESTKYQSTPSTDAGVSSLAFEKGTNPSLMPHIFPYGEWIQVPGSSTFGTADFYVMTYEAKYDKDGDGKADDANNCYYTSGYDTWDWGKTGTDCPSTWSNTNVISSPYGSPIAGVTHNEAKAICASLGAHLITNQEWMAIARNAEQQDQNWSGGSVGSGCLFRGNDNETNNSCGYNGSDPEKGTNRNPKAKLVLSNSKEIWDLAGNVWEHVQKDINDTLVNNTPTDGGAAGWRWIEHTAITGYGDFSYDEIRPSNSAWNSTQGMGRVWTYNGAYSPRVLLRGGSWGDGAYAGAFTLDLDWGTTTQSNNVGFRCAR